jgi:hypothetical protein
MNLRAIDDRDGMIEQRDLARQPAYQPWLEAAKHYRCTWGAGVATAGNERALVLRLERQEHAILEETLRTAYLALQPGDVVIIDIAGATDPDRQRSNREWLGQALFKAGFDHPMIWAGLQLLQAEVQSWLGGVFLTRRALGAAPSVIAGVRSTLNIAADRMIAITRRGSLAPPAERPLRLSVVMPVYNEKDTFRVVVERLLAKTIPGIEIEICIVESNSTDGTRDDVLRYQDSPRIRLLLEDKPSGKGHAVRKGLQVASGDIVLIQDADLEYDLDDYEKLLRPIVSNQASFVLGSRHRAGESVWQLRQFSDQHGLARLLNLGHLFFTWLFNIIFQQRLRDPFTMFKVFRRDCINNLRFTCNRFDFDPELVGKLIRNGYQPIEIDIRYESRSFRQGKKVSFFRDPPTWIRACLQHRYSRLYVWPASD